MTASEAIARAKEIRQGSIGYSQYLSWLNVIEGRVQTELLEKNTDEVIKYTEETDASELIIPHPYDEVYIFYLCAMTDFANEEMELYSADAQAFDSRFEDFKKYYSKTSGNKTVRISGWWNS